MGPATATWVDSYGRPLIIAGPCSAETEDQTLETARQLHNIGAVSVFRAGVWKPRTRIGCFEGVGDRGLRWLQKVKAETGFETAVEVTLPWHIEKCLEAGIDVLWIGARTSVNPILVGELAKSLRGVDIPVLVKNPVNPDLDAWIGALERFDFVGIRRLAAVHRGFSTLDNGPFRNAPQWQIPMRLMSLLPDLPVICDPSHIAGSRSLLFPICVKALEMGAHGFMIESHIHPDEALSDGEQQLQPHDLHDFLRQLNIGTQS